MNISYIIAYVVVLCALANIVGANFLPPCRSLDKDQCTSYKYNFCAFCSSTHTCTNYDPCNHTAQQCNGTFTHFKYHGDGCHIYTSVPLVQTLNAFTAVPAVIFGIVSMVSAAVNLYATIRCPDHSNDRHNVKTPQTSKITKYISRIVFNIIIILFGILCYVFKSKSTNIKDMYITANILSLIVLWIIFMFIILWYILKYSTCYQKIHNDNIYLKIPDHIADA